ncbi:hypothetical protein GN244_ATG04724 [Phytophthora infestans]|uniref:Uncharacterized protein n=1 Tax=Phytophthora infestans TaxID=4787 RepID=A0A833WJB2_PHYIN|nr:hypothetical protein GN244_ATG04724 [Phytophthora infestans]
MADQPNALRDPTLAELYTGPERALPDEIQQLPTEDTACTFCGVSYFVFAEVQALQTTVKQYKKTFRDFVRFMEHERSVARDLRQQVAELKGSLADLVAACSASIKQISEQSEAHRTAKEMALNQLQHLQQEIKKSEVAQREFQIREEEQKLVYSLVEQKLRNEILHLSSQMESCKLLSESQQADFKEENDRDQQRIRELESKIAERQEQWTVAERQIVTERDALKQQLLAMNERVELESSTARQLEGQFTAIREELSRVVAASDTERKSSSQMNSEIIQLKHQLQNLERTRAQLLADNGRYKDDKYKLEDEIKALRLRADTLQGQLSVSTTSTQKIKSEYTHDLENLRQEHGSEICRLQREHVRAIEELKESQNNYLECLKKESAQHQARGEESSRHALLAMQDRVKDAERRANEWKDRALQNASEREEAKRNSSRFENIIETLQGQLDACERDKQKLVQKAKTERTELEQRLKIAQNEVQQERNSSLQEVEQRQSELQNENAALKQHVDSLQNQLRRQREQPTAPVQPQAAWHCYQTDNSKPSRQEPSNQDQDCHDSEAIIAQLRNRLKQKDREISLLQQTVHRECMERTSLLERMRSSKVLPEIAIPSLAAPNSISSSSCNDTEDCTERSDHSVSEHQPPKASFYENSDEQDPDEPSPESKE